MPMRIMAVCNQKGGTGKTSSAWAILCGAKARGLRALGLDMDIQGNLSFIAGADSAGLTTGDIMKGKPIKEAIQHTAAGDIIPAGISIAALPDVDALKRAVMPLKGAYDLVVIDCPPTLSKPLLAALRAATEAIIPTTADALGIQGLYQLRTSIDQANPALHITGVFLARHNGRSVLARDIMDTVKERCAALHFPFINAPIREAIAVREAQLLQQNLFDYAPRAKVTADYSALLDAINIK